MKQSIELAVIVSFVALLSSVLRADENVIFTELLQKGVPLSNGDTIKLPAPVMADGLNEATQLKVMTGLTDSKHLESFLKGGLSDRYELKKSQTPGAKKEDSIGRQIDLYFVAAGKLATAADSAFVKKLLTQNVPNPKGKAEFYTDKELTARELAVTDTGVGVPEADRHELSECIEHAFDFRGEREAFETTPEGAAAHARMFEYGRALIAAKRDHPTDDMLSVVVHARLADVDPPALSDGELYAFFNLLFAAGSETTRNAVAGGLLALLQAPQQLAALRAEPRALPPALEEMLRWTTPAPSKRRTATRATELGGHTIRPGDKVLFWEGSANRDERVFARAMEFDVRREPNPHLAFGNGVHFCLGANLARISLANLRPVGMVLHGLRIVFGIR
jgi:hypothetical protein